MISTQYKSASSIAFPTAIFPNRDIIFKQYPSNLEQGFSINTVSVLSGVRDTKINGYTSFYLSNKSQLTNFFYITSYNTDIQTITTRLRFNTTEPKYVYIYKTNSLSAVDYVKPVGIVTETQGAFSNNYKFELEVIDKKLIRIKHNDGKNDFYLNYSEVINDFFFYLNNSQEEITQERTDTFRYSIDSDGYLQIYSIINDRLYVLTLNNQTQRLTFVPAASGATSYDAFNLIEIDYNFNTLENNLNNSFVSYLPDKLNSLTVNYEKSDFNGVNQILLHTAYNTISSDSVEINFANLNTNRSEYNYVKRGSNLFDAADYAPSYDFRDYKSIYTGVDQEGGSESITLNYTFYDKDIIVYPDTTTVFRAPSSIYPYEVLNINDSTFVQNGSFGAPTPILADKVSVKRNNNEYYSDGRYLCTWLSANRSDVPGVWVDRYYYPDKITKLEALSAENKYNPSFANSVDGIGDLNALDTLLVEEAFFDKQSDVAILPNAQIKYERIGPNGIRDITLAGSPIISSFESFYTAKVTSSGEYLTICNNNNTDSFTYDGSKYHKLDIYQSINAKKAFTISFDAYVDINNQYGFQLIGNNTNAGFGVFQDLTITPFLHVAFENKLYLYNTDGVLISLVEFDSTIKDIFKRTAMDDYIVTCTGNKIYKVDAKGNKLKLETESQIFGYVGTLQEENNIIFALQTGKAFSLDINTLEVEEVIPKIFPAYEGLIDTYPSIVRYNGELYRIPSNNIRYEDNNTTFYTLSNLVIKHQLNLNPVTFCRSSSTISDICVIDGDVYIATDNKVHVFTTNGVSRGVIDIDTIPGLSGGAVVTLDGVNEYITGVNYKYVNALCVDIDQNTFLVKNIFSSPGIDTTTIQLSGISSRPTSLDVANDGRAYLVRLTNYNRITQLYDSKTLDFRLTLQNYLNTEDKLTKTISLDITALEPGYHTFTYRYDSIQGNASLYVDSNLYENQTFQPGKYAIQDTFNDELYMGAAGFFNGVDLAEYLKQPTHYYVNNLSLKNLFVYDRALSTTEIYALDLLDMKINNLVVSLPGGQRNNKEEIERFYRFGRYNSSKSVDIVIKNLNSPNEDITTLIKNNILNEAKQILPVGVVINDIKFVNYL